MVGGGKLPDPLLNRIFNSLSIDVQYTLSFQWTKFGLNCLIREFCSTKISPKNWVSFLSNVIKEKRKFRKTDHGVDNEIEPVIIKYCFSSKVIVIEYTSRATWHTFQPKLKKILKIHLEKNSLYLGNGTS